MSCAMGSLSHIHEAAVAAQFQARAAQVHAGPPSIERALERAEARLPKDASGAPSKYGGILAPLSAVRTLGADAMFYMQAIQVPAAPVGPRP